jgi:hypothetical protein
MGAEAAIFFGINRTAEAEQIQSLLALPKSKIN